MNPWYVVGWIAMLSIPIDVAIANNAHAATWLRLIFTGLLLAHGCVALWAFRKSSLAPLPENGEQ